MVDSDFKKVALLTCFLDNCGACLQAYALQKTVNFLGYSSEIIRFTEPAGYYSNTIKNNYAFFDYLRCLKSKEFRKKYLNGLYRVTAFNQFRKKYLLFSKKEYKTYHELATARMDFFAYVCGSDQIWNPTFYGKCNPAYYLAFVPDNILKIAYAPSIGISDIPPIYKDDFRKLIKRLDYISVREMKGVELIEKYANRTAKFVLDPTLLLDVEKWDVLAKNKRNKKPYLFCYLFGKHTEYSEIIKKFKETLGCEAIGIPIFVEDIEKDYIKAKNAGPIEFLSLIKNAEFIVTDSFHATVFSIIFQKSFYTILRDSDEKIESMNSRLFNLLHLVNMEDRLLTVNQAMTIDAAPIEEEKFILAHKIIDNYRLESTEYLKNSLEGV